MLVAPQDAAAKAFDYIIIGGGTAGLTLAASLTEDVGITVLVIEAGGANINDPDILRPASFGSHFTTEQQTWQHMTVGQKHAHDKVHFWPRGKGLGGSSAINFSIYTKPSKEELDDLERLGNPGWNWESFQSALQKVEGFVEPSEAAREKFRLPVDTEGIGSNGPVKIAYPGLMHETEIQVQQAFINAGVPIAPNPLSGDPRGVYFTPNLLDPSAWTRSYATSAFYLPNRSRENLYVLVDSHVCRITTETKPDGQLKAQAVEFLHARKQYRVQAIREVIVSAGTLHSPQILELSGIGKRDVLETIGVSTKLELPGVGENLQEHVVLCVTFELKDDVEYDTLELLRDPEVLKQNLELHAQGTGLFTMGFTSVVFVPPQALTTRAGELYEAAKTIYNVTDSATSPGLAAQYRIMMERLEPDSKHSGPGCQFIIAPGAVQLPATHSQGMRYVSLYPAMNYQWSRGSVHCISSDPLQDPAIDPHYFEHAIDLDIFTESTKFARDLAQVSPLKDMIKGEILPGLEVSTDAELRDWIQDSFNSTWHSAGTCSMLPRELGGVVDANLKVYGTSNIRVVDLSILPLQAATHPCSLVYAIATRAGEFIKADFTSEI